MRTLPNVCAATIFCIPITMGVLLAAPNEPEDQAMTYRVTRVERTSTVDADWDGEFWRDVKPLELRHFMGERPEHFPRVQAKLVYDEHAVHVIFHVDDRYVRAVAENHQDAVYRDSCVEFFFTPGEDVSNGYFNLEMNCGGTMLLHYQREPRQNQRQLADTDLAKIEVAHSLPKIVQPEMTEPVEWTVAYRLPVALFEKYFPSELNRPAPGVRWRANFYKCADDSSHPHWLTWSPVNFEQPDFHRPQSFGTLVFE